MNKGCQNNVLSLPQQAKLAKRPRKTDINQAREGSVRRINNHVYVDFIYLGKRVREPSGLKWNEENFKKVRRAADRIMDAIESARHLGSTRCFSKQERGVLSKNKKCCALALKESQMR
jgi:hypothetical protein